MLVPGGTGSSERIGDTYDHLALVDVDLWRFEAALTRARSARADKARGAYQRAAGGLLRCWLLRRRR